MRFRVPLWGRKSEEPEEPLGAGWGDWALPREVAPEPSSPAVMESKAFPVVTAVVAAPEPLPEPVSVRADWVLTEESEPGKDVSVTFGGVPGRRHHLTVVSASFNQHCCGYLTLLFNGRKRMQWYVHNALVLALTQPIVVGVGEGVMLYLHLVSPRRSAGADLAGYVNLVGFTDE